VAGGEKDKKIKPNLFTKSFIQKRAGLKTTLGGHRGALELQKELKIRGTGAVHGGGGGGRKRNKCARSQP